MKRLQYIPQHQAVLHMPMILILRLWQLLIDWLQAEGWGDLRHEPLALDCNGSGSGDFFFEFIHRHFSVNLRHTCAHFKNANIRQALLFTSHCEGACITLARVPGRQMHKHLRDLIACCKCSVQGVLANHVQQISTAHGMKGTERSKTREPAGRTPSCQAYGSRHWAGL